MLPAFPPRAFINSIYKKNLTIAIFIDLPLNSIALYLPLLEFQKSVFRTGLQLMITYKGPDAIVITF